MLLIVLLATEILTLVVLRHHFYDRSWMRYYFLMTINAVLSIWLWILYFNIKSHNGFIDEPDHLWAIQNLYGMICAVVVPRVIIVIFHFSGMFFRKKSSGHNRKLTNTGFSIAAVIFTVTALGTFIGRFNFKTERVDVTIEGLHEDLHGLKIVHISDLHLVSFYHHQETLEEVMNEISRLNPDLILNTGDFINVGWREFGRVDTILNKAMSRYGNFAVLGNHDFGTYNPHFTDADRRNNVLLINRFVSLSGYEVLNDEHIMLDIGDSKLALIGVGTMGSFPDIIHHDVGQAYSGISGSDMEILLAHDPNQWDLEVAGKTQIDLTLAGHTHGMQIGIVTKSFKWSPARFFYSRWNGLYKEGDQYLYVNRGLGVLGIPLRIWMPPEITLITLIAE